MSYLIFILKLLFLFLLFFFFFNDTATTEIYTLSLHDALPICQLAGDGQRGRGQRIDGEDVVVDDAVVPRRAGAVVAEVVALHLLVAREPARVVVDAVAQAAGGCRAALAARRDAVGLGDRKSVV